MTIRPFHKILCANRGEIAIRVFRACAELGIRTVAVFSDEDATNQHRYKADESYLIGRGKPPVAAYLGGDEILAIAQRAKADAIHPGYGFLSENHAFAAAVRAAGIAFIGPKAEVISGLGDKVLARNEAQRLGIPTVPGSELPLDEGQAIAMAEAFFAQHGTTIFKAAHGGGGRGMRVVEDKKDLVPYLRQARSESLAAFGSPVVFVEKYLPRGGTSRCRSSATPTATSCTCTNATARCSAATRRWSRSRRRRTSTRRCGRRCSPTR